MMNGSTPFYDKNRKLMFYRIMNREPTFPPTFSSEAQTCITGLLCKRENERLGYGDAGARNLMQTAFFSVIDFEALMRKELAPPFTPEVKGEEDTAYVPDSLLKTEAKDSFSEPRKKGEAAQKFEAFTFVGDSTLGDR
jgi:hypothetical protein